MRGSDHPLAGVSSHTWAKGAALTLVATWSMVWVALGGVNLVGRVGLHLGMMVAALALAATSARWRSHLRGRDVLAAASLLMVGAGLAAIPLPAGILAWVAPGVLEARPDAVLWSSALEPGQVFDRLGELCALTIAMLVGVAHPVDRESGDARLQRGVVVGTAAVLLFAWLHALTGADAVLGLVRPQQLGAGPWLAPLVNPNFLATVLVLTLPLMLSIDASSELHRPARFLAAAAVGTTLWISSVGGIAALGLVLLLLGGRYRVAAAACVVGAVVVGALDIEGVESVSGRWQVWTAALALLAAYPLFGAGGFEPAVSPYRVDSWFADLGHVHSEPLEWLVSTGVIGALLGLAALGLLARGVRPQGRVGRAVTIGLIGAGVHACMDFPLQVPAVALLLASGVGLVVGTAGRRGLPRTPLLLLALSQVVAAGWVVRQDQVRSRIDIVRMERTGVKARAAAERLDRLGARSGWSALQRAWAAAELGDRDGAVEQARAAVSEAPYDAAVLREAAHLSLVNGDMAGAAALAERAVQRAPWDYRGRVLQARQARLLGTTEEVRRGWAEAFAREAPQPLLSEAYRAIPSAAVWHDVLRDLDPGWMAALGRVADRAGESEAAVRAFEQAAARDPDRYASFAPHGAALLSAGDPDAARALVTAALAARPSDAGTQRTASEVFAELGEVERSLVALERAAELNPIHRPMLVRRLAEHEGLEAVLVRVEGWALSSRRSPAVDLELARQALVLGDRGLCQQLAGRWFDDPRDGEAARSLSERCAR